MMEQKNCKKRKEKFTLFSDHNGSLLRRRPRARTIVSHVQATLSEQIIARTAARQQDKSVCD